METSIIQQEGYVWISHPREGIMPLSLIETDNQNSIQRVWNNLFDVPQEASALPADIFSLFPKPKRGQVPTVNEKPKEAAFFKGHDILGVKAGVIVKTIEKLSFAGTAKAFSNIEVADKLLFSFKNVNLYGVENIILLEEHINIAKPSSKAPGFLEKLQNGCIFVVTEVLQTNDFVVRNVGKSQYSGKIEADAIKDFVNAEASLDAETESDEKIAYKGEKYVTFALKAFKILYDEKENNYKLRNKPLKIVRGKDTIEGEILKTDDGLLNLE
jgi:hypothetical protein